MKKLKDFLNETFLSIGLNPKHEVHRHHHADEIFNLMRKSYANVEGGYGGKGTGTEAEEADIRADIHNPNHIIKAVRRNGKISAVTIYKKHHGRKSIAIGTDGTTQGKLDVKKVMMDDKKMERSWAEVSGAPEAIKRKIGFPVVPAHRAKELTGKPDIRIKDHERYVRKIGTSDHEKVIMGYPKKT